MDSSLSHKPDVGEQNYYDDDSTDSLSLYQHPNHPPPMPVSAAPAALYDRSELTVGGRQVTLLPTTALLPLHHTVFPSHPLHTASHIHPTRLSACPLIARDRSRVLRSAAVSGTSGSIRFSPSVSTTRTAPTER